MHVPNTSTPSIIIFANAMTMAIYTCPMCQPKTTLQIFSRSLSPLPLFSISALISGYVTCLNASHSRRRLRCHYIVLAGLFQAIVFLSLPLIPPFFPNHSTHSHLIRIHFIPYCYTYRTPDPQDEEEYWSYILMPDTV